MKKAVFRERYTQPPLELDVVICHYYLADIGGIESWLYYVAKKYNVGQITVLYSIGSLTQAKRLSQYVNVIQYTGQKITCNKMIFTMTTYIPQELYEGAKQKYLTVHCNYRSKFNYGFREIPTMDKVYAVSDVARDAFKELQEQEVFTLYNPIAIDKPKRVLKLISATRLTEEKGEERYFKLAEELDKKNIPYLWLIFTDKIPNKVNKNIILMQPRYNIPDYIREADYGVQLSSDESYCLFVQECLILDKPVIVTDLPVFKEEGITDKEAYFLKLDMSNLDVEKIYKHIPKVQGYKPKESDKEYKKLLEGKDEEEDF